MARAAPERQAGRRGVQRPPVGEESAGERADGPAQHQEADAPHERPPEQAQELWDRHVGHLLFVAWSGVDDPPSAGARRR
jgi:hypothetical protein